MVCIYISGYIPVLGSSWFGSCYSYFSSCWITYGGLPEFQTSYGCLNHQLATKCGQILGTFLFFQSCWPTRDHIGRSTGISNPAWHLPQVRWQGLFRPQVPCTPNLHCPNASPASTQSQQPKYWTAIQIRPTLRVSSNTQATLKRKSPTQDINRAQHCLTSVIVREQLFPLFSPLPSPPHILCARAKLMNNFILKSSNVELG